MKYLDFIKTKIRGSINLPRLIRDGLVIGENFNAMEGVIIDPGHCWLIEIGSDVTLAPRVHVLAHDASMKKSLGYARIGKVKIGNHCFIGAGSIILPNVTIDDNTIVGAGSVVTTSLKGGGVWVGNPCKKIEEYDLWISKICSQIEEYPVFDEKFKIGAITDEMKEEMKKKLDGNVGFIR